MSWKDYAGFLGAVPLAMGGRLGPRSQDPAKQAMPYLNQAEGMYKENLNPYIEQGKTAFNNTQPTYDQMSQNPSQFYDNLFSKYSETEGFKRSRQNALDAARNSAAAGGFAGTPYDQEQQARLANDLSQENYQQYFNNIRDVQNTGFGGQEKAIERGYGANQDLTSLLSQLLGSKAGMSFQGASQNNQNRSNFMRMLAQALGAAGGAAVGGPTGATIGANIGGNVTNGGA
jgi:hypothetical protein